MRIISGNLKGRRLAPPKGINIRPTTDQAREALFNILANHYLLEECRVLDLFSGTGAVSLEFLSRGANSVVSVENLPKAADAIRRISIEWGIDGPDVICADAFKFISRTSEVFDLIFADPPFDHPGISELPALVRENEILRQGGLFILEHPKGFLFNNERGFLETRKYGHVRLSLFGSQTTS